MFFGLTEILLTTAVVASIYLYRRWTLTRTSDIELGQQALQRERSRWNPTELTDQRILVATQALSSAPRKSTSPIKVFLIDANYINAMSLPGGIVLITAGMYDSYRRGQISRDELTAVIAHEIAHSDLSHSRRRMGNSNIVNSVTHILTGQRLSWWSEALRFVSNAGLNHYHKRDEFEADHYAFELLCASEFDERALESILRKLMRARQPTVTDWLSRHPPTLARIEKLRSYRDASR